ncbi:MAG: UDP-3-O-(3-hydroxymyristoyl)glucosamine N-acyltransferase [Candidatus Zixiibacteriota bacterium]|nr:MAG: UDP-3-O-(3-hydroxymyristoyl)glucosamine N-acyltransferase [candidate division Zixibacteria bacterium]
MNSKISSVFSLRDIAEKVGGEIEGNADVKISGVAPIESAGAGQISFVANPRYFKYVATTLAAALVLDYETKCSRLPVLRHPSPHLTFARIVDLFYPDEPLVQPGIHSSSVIDNNVQIDSTAGVGPLCHICDGAVVGPGCQLTSSVFIGHGVTLGENCRLYPGVKVLDGSRIGNNVIIHSSTVVGSDGFGFAESETGLKKVKQVGWVEIDDDVEIGSNVSIDRGALGPTRIGRGTKIDNLVQIAHNVEIGQHSIIVSQVGISGSTKVGNGVVLAGQVGVVGHIEIGDGVKVGAQSGISKSVQTGKTIFGTPARDIMTTKRIEASLTRLPELIKRVKKIEKKLDK